MKVVKKTNTKRKKTKLCEFYKLGTPFRRVPKTRGSYTTKVFDRV